MTKSVLGDPQKSVGTFSEGHIEGQISI